MCIAVGEDSEYVRRSLKLLGDCVCIWLSGRDRLLFQKVIILAKVGFGYVES